MEADMNTKNFDNHNDDNDNTNCYKSGYDNTNNNNIILLPIIIVKHIILFVLV